MDRWGIGSVIAQEIALIRPHLPRRVVLLSVAPQGAARDARLGAGGHPFLAEAG